MTYIAQELPALMEGWFPLLVNRKERFICGLSMGGWIIVRLFLRCFIWTSLRIAT
ncbi:MAG: hypothetical protein IJ214_12955 [Clostridia bacterium]|nr:hypothetical protein [Clostridia bacterium]